MKALLDTSILIPLFEPHQTTPDLSSVDEALVSTLSFAELAIGVSAAIEARIVRHRMSRLAMVRQLFGEGLPFDHDCVKAYEQILDHVADQGGDIKARRFDRMIAATALAHEATLVTRNLADVAQLAPLVDIQEL
jgi:predicted nucleic acid-binding protein